MTVTLNLVPRSRVSAPAIHRFPAELRPQLEEFADVSPRMRQLAVSFPVLLVAIATHYAGAPARNAAVRAVLEGQPLAAAADALGFPYCFRHLPPEAACRGLPPATWTSSANRQLAPHVPREPRQAARWLWIVQHANMLAGERFAVWCARQPGLLAARHFSPFWLTPLAMHAWYTTNNASAAAPPADLHWKPRVGLERAIADTRCWLRYVNLTALLGADGLQDPWFNGGRSRDYTITPLLTPRQILEEAHRMRNCIASYGEELSSNAARLFKLSEGDRSIAIFELRPLGPDREAHITQLKGPGNSECAKTVWEAAQRWLDSHDDIRCPTQSWHVRAARRRRTHDLLAPYAHAVPGAGLDPTDATTLSRLQMTLVSLARETGATGAFRSPLRRLLG